MQTGKQDTYDDGMPRIGLYRKIRLRSTDEHVRVEDPNTVRYDLLSYEYYGDCGYEWLIQHAQRGYDSPGYVRVPLPLSDALKDMGMLR